MSWGNTKVVGIHYEELDRCLYWLITMLATTIDNHCTYRLAMTNGFDWNVDIVIHEVWGNVTLYFIINEGWSQNWHVVIGCDGVPYIHKFGHSNSLSPFGYWKHFLSTTTSHIHHPPIHPWQHGLIIYIHC